MHKLIVATGVAVSLAAQLTFAAAGDRSGALKSNGRSEPEIVRWTGEIKDSPSSHTTKHWHNLEFIRQSDGKEFDITSSPELVKLHHETEKNFLVEIEAEKTPRFLFWGGNLIVKSFRVLKETSPAIAHNKTEQSKSVSSYSHR